MDNIDNALKMQCKKKIPVLYTMYEIVYKSHANSRKEFLDIGKVILKFAFGEYMVTFRQVKRC